MMRSGDTSKIRRLPGKEIAWHGVVTLPYFTASREERRTQGESPLVSQIITLLNSLSPPSLKHCILMS
jgi:hypothetical protein